MYEGSLTDILEKRHHVRLTWETYEPGVTKDGNRVPCWIQSLATVHDIINYHRKPGQPQMTDAEILSDFIAQHGADVSPGLFVRHPGSAQRQN